MPRIEPKTRADVPEHLHDDGHANTASANRPTAKANNTAVRILMQLLLCTLFGVRSHAWSHFTSTLSLRHFTF